MSHHRKGQRYNTIAMWVGPSEQVFAMKCKKKTKTLQMRCRVAKCHASLQRRCYDFPWRRMMLPVCARMLSGLPTKKRPVCTGRNLINS
jgi:hypothetical protein